MKTSKCTYRVTKTTKPAMKRVLVKYTYHCQHYKKPLSQKHLSAHLLARKPSKNPLTADIRHKKISNCPSTLVVTIQIPTKKQIRLANKHPYLLTHKTQMTLKFCHNHFVYSAHGLSFVPVSEDTKQKIFSLFYKGHNAASARHARETELMLECAENGTPLQPVLANTSINPLAQGYSRLFAKWRCSEMGSDDNGPLMFEKLQEVVEEYNTSSDGRASLQVFERHCVAADCDSTQDAPSQKRRKLEGTKPMILTICTPLMMRASATIQQAGEMVFCDSTSTLDRLNTSMFILSTSTSASGIPLGVMVISDEQQSTIKKGIRNVS